MHQFTVYFCAATACRALPAKQTLVAKHIPATTYLPPSSHLKQNGTEWQRHLYSMKALVRS